MYRGYFMVSRNIFESPINDKPAEYLKVWLYLIGKAHFKDKGNLKRGEGFTSIDEIAEHLSYYKGFTKVKPSRKKVWGIIDWLRRTDEGNNEGDDKGTMIVTTKVTHGFTYKVLNYDIYQSVEYYEGNTEGNNEIPMKEQRRGREGNNIKKNDNKEEEYSNTGISDIVTPSNKNSERNKIYTEVYKHYMDLKIIKHKSLTDAMKKAIDKAMRECKYTVEDMKKLLDRHKAKVESTKSDGKYAVKPRTLHEFFGQRVSGGVHLICQDYEDGAKYGDAIKSEQPKRKVLTIVEIERSRGNPDRVIGETVREI